MNITITKKRMDFDDLLETVMDDFVELSELTYEAEFQRYLRGLPFSWLEEVNENA